MLVRRLLFILSIVLAGVVAQYDLSDNSTLLWCSKVSNTKQLCYVNAHRYGYCEEGVTCNPELQICSDSSQVLYGFTKPIFLSEEASKVFMTWGAIISLYGLILVFYQRNKQPMRTRNINFYIVEIIIQLLLIRLLMGQKATDPCFLTYTVNLVGLSSGMFNFFAQTKIKQEKKLAKIVSTISALDDTKETEITNPKHMLDSLFGAILVACACLGLGALSVALFTDIPFTDLSACNTIRGYPNTPECGFGITIAAYTLLITYAIFNYKTIRIISVQIEFWLHVLTIFITVSLMSCYGVMLTVGNALGIVIQVNVTYVSFIIIFFYNVSVRCLLPTLYNRYYVEQSKFDDDIREQFFVAEKQPFAMEKLAEFAGTELETDSVVLYQAVRSLLELRNSTKDTFESCDRLAKLIFNNYISGTRNTLYYYDMQSIVKNVKSPIELLEREAVIVQLNTQIIERIMLPMFARMTKM